MLKTTMAILGTTLAFGGLAAGCGESDEDRVKAAYHGWYADVAAGRAAQACGRMTKHSRASLQITPEEGCESLVTQFKDGLTSVQREHLPSIKVQEVEIDGERAFIYDHHVTLPRELDAHRDADDEPATLHKVDGRWLIEDLG